MDVASNELPRKAGRLYTWCACVVKISPHSALSNRRVLREHFMAFNIQLSFSSETKSSTERIFLVAPEEGRELYSARFC
jgi:hypothetical protein